MSVPAEAAPPVPAPVYAKASPGGVVPGGSLNQQPAALSGALQINAGSVTVIGSGGAAARSGAGGSGDLHAPAATSRSESGAAGSRAPAGGGSAEGWSSEESAAAGRFESGSRGSSGAPRSRPSTAPVYYDGTPATDGAPIGKATDRGFQRPEGATPDDFDLDDLNEVFRPSPVRSDH